MVARELETWGVQFRPWQNHHQSILSNNKRISTPVAGTSHHSIWKAWNTAFRLTPLSGAAFIYTFALPPVGQCLCRSSVDGRDRDHSLLGQDLCLRSPYGSSGVLRSSCGRWCVGLSIYATTMAITGAFTMVLVASTPLFLPWPVAFFCVFHGTILSVSMGSAPMAFYSWHAMET